MMKEFAAIREIASHQVLCYTESNEDGCSVNVLFRTEAGLNFKASLGFPEENEMNLAFSRFKNGELDKHLEAQIKDAQNMVTETSPNPSP